MSGEKWVWSTSEETFGSDEFDSREAALADGLAEAREWHMPAVYTGRVRRLTVAEFCGIDGDDVLERMALAAYDRAGEVAEDWPEVHEDDVRELGEVLSVALQKWAQENIGDPTFFEVVDVERHALPESQSVLASDTGPGREP